MCSRMDLCVYVLVLVCVCEFLFGCVRVCACSVHGFVRFFSLCMCVCLCVEGFVLSYGRQLVGACVCWYFFCVCACACV
jgi:hypothetical protein